MLDQDGLYLNRKWVAPATGIASTYQSNDLSKPATLQTSYTNTFTIPDSVKFRQLTEFAEQLDSGSKYPYKALPAYVIDGGEVVFTGIAEMNEFSGGWKVVLFEEKRNLFDRLDRSIRTADLARFDHAWKVEEINARSASTDGVCYPVVDYGLISGNTIPLDTMFPATFAHTIIRQLLKEEGYSFVGDLPADPMFKKLIIPFVEQEGTNHDQKWSDDRKARVTQDNPDYEVHRSSLGSKSIMDRIQPFSIDNRPAETWSQGILKNYNVATYTYVCDSAMRVKVDAFQGFKVRITSGAVEFKLQVIKNGNVVHEEYVDYGGPHDILYIKQDKLEIHKTIPCQVGDRLQIRFFAARQTTIGGFDCKIFNDPFNSWVAFTPDLSLHTGDNWPVARNLPDLTGTSLLVSVAQIFGGTWSVDNRRRQIKFVGLSATVANVANAVDWSNRIDTGQEPTWTPKIDPYAQANYLKWKETDDTKVEKPEIAYGDGVINIASDSLDVDTDLFELPFGASILSKTELSGYGNPVRIETRTASGTGDNVTISNKNAAPRLLLVSLGEAVPIATKRLQSDGITLEDVTVKLRPCWFGPRPNVAISAETGFCLCFSPVKNLRGEVTLIDRHYAGLKRVLRRMRVLSVAMRLLPEDVSKLDFGAPIRLKRVEVQSLVLSDGLYFLNTVSGYQSNSTCTVRLIAF